MATIKNSDKNKILSLLKKVSELSKKGIGGERENAKQLLNKLLKKYNLTNFELNKKPKKRIFKLINFDDCKIIMAHCILDTVDDASIEGLKSKKELYCKLTDEQYIDVCEKFNHYYPEFYSQIENHNKKKDSLLKAFLIKNNLGITDAVKNEELPEENIDGIKEMMSEVKENRFVKKDLKQIA